MWSPRGQKIIKLRTRTTPTLPTIDISKIEELNKEQPNILPPSPYSTDGSALRGSPGEIRPSPSSPAIMVTTPTGDDVPMSARESLNDLKKQVKKTKDNIYMQDNYHQNMLHIACYEGRTENVAYLLGKYKESDLRLRDKNGWTPLHCAASQGHVDICEMLLKKGASPNAQNGSLTSPFAYAARLNLTDDIRRLLDLMLQRGAEINVQNKWGETALHSATAKGLLNTSEYLLDHGAEVNIINSFGETPLHKACRMDRLELVKMLVSRGANAFLSGYCGTPLTIARTFQILPTMEYLKTLKRDESKTYSVHHSNITVGPSIDNIDIAAMLSIRTEESGASGPSASDKLIEGDIVKQSPGFGYETGKNNMFSQEDNNDLIDLRIENDDYSFDYGEDGDLFTALGVAKIGLEKEFVVVMIVRSPDKQRYRGVFRTRSGDHKFFIPAALVPMKRRGSTGPGMLAKKSLSNCDKHMLTVLRTHMPDVQFTAIENVGLNKELRQMDEATKQEMRRYKVGVLYVREGQTTDEEIFGNRDGSEAFERFLLFLGQRVKLMGFTGYNGDLDVTQNANGEYSIYARFNNVEIMFHVSTYLPYDDLSELQIQRKKIICNDLVAIVYMDSGQFLPQSISSDFLHIYLVVQSVMVDNEERYQLAVCSRLGVPQFGPPIPTPPVFKQDQYFHDFLITKILNGSRAVVHHPFIVGRAKRTKQIQLERISREYLSQEKEAKRGNRMAVSTGDVATKTESASSLSPPPLSTRPSRLSANLGTRKVVPGGPDTTVADIKAKLKKDHNLLYQQDEYQQTILHMACFEGHEAVVAYILPKYKESDMKLRDKNGWTPLHAAAAQGHLNICEMLLKKGASPNAQNGTLTSPFAYAARLRSNDQSIALWELMLEKGAEINVVNKWGDTPLHAAATKGLVETSQWLIYKGADVNAANTFGETALHKACRLGSLNVVKILVENGADIKMSGYCGTPITVARTSRSQDVTNYLDTLLQSADQNTYKVVTSAPSSDGPSIDNIDMAALLSFRSEEAASMPIRLDRPEETDMVVFNEEFYFEIGKNDFFKSTDQEKDKNKDLLDLRIENANYGFDYAAAGDDVITIVGMVKSATPGRPAEPMVISLMRTAIKGKHRALIRTQTGDHRFFLPVALLKGSKKGSQLSGKHIDKNLVKTLKEHLGAGVQLTVIQNPKLTQELVRMEEMKKNETRRYKIGILYAKAGQTDESEIFGNKDGSEAFESFLTFLGEKVKLQGWPNYRGDLDVKHNTNGEYSIYTRLGDVEIMFHVSTYLPYDERDPQQIPRKKYIGNDLMTLVFLEPGGTFRPPCVSGDFLHLFAVVSPCVEDGVESYKLALCTRTGVPQYGPPIPSPPIFARSQYFREFLLTKLLNGERAVMHCPFIQSKMRRTRQMQLEYIVKEFL